MLTALLIVVFIGVCGLWAWTLDYEPDDRIKDTMERRWQDIRRERSRRFEE